MEFKIRNTDNDWISLFQMKKNNDSWTTILDKNIKINSESLPEIPVNKLKNDSTISASLLPEIPNSKLTELFNNNNIKTELIPNLSISKIYDLLDKDNNNTIYSKLLPNISNDKLTELFKYPDEINIDLLPRDVITTINARGTITALMLPSLPISKLPQLKVFQLEVDDETKTLTIPSYTVRYDPEINIIDD